MAKKIKILKEVFSFLIENKKWWLAPIVIVLVLFGTVLAFSQGSVVAPFIYTIF